MDIRPTAVNVLVIGFSMILFAFVWRMLAAYVEESNPQLAGAMGTVV